MKRTLLSVLLIVMTCALLAQAGTIRGNVSGGNGESVVYVEAQAGKTYPAPTAHPTIDQKGLMFQPHITVVQVGATVDFLNSDSVAHNVFWTSVGGNKKLTHNLGTWPKGEKRPFKFDNPGAVPLLCNVHPEMAGYVVVSPTPYFAMNEKQGAKKIKNVPVASDSVSGGHEGASTAAKPVTVAGDSKADFTLSK